MRKSIAVVFGITLSVSMGWFMAGCASTKGPVPTPKAPGCVLTVQALGSTIVAGLSWTNPATGHTGSGMTIYPESGSTLLESADESVSCKTNSTPSLGVSMVCHGTNMPQAIVLSLPVNCNGFQSTVTFNCDNCTFGASTPIGAWCNIGRPSPPLHEKGR